MELGLRVSTGSHQDAMKQITDKAAELGKEQKSLQDAAAQLEAKRQSKTLESAEPEIRALTERRVNIRTMQRNLRRRLRRGRRKARNSTMNSQSKD